MDNNYHHVLVDAKTEYTKQLVSMLTPRIYEGISSIYDYAHNGENSKIRNYLVKFQTLLSDIPKWDSNIISKEYQRIIEKSDCEWIDDLITAVFVSHTKVLTAIKVNKQNTKTIDLKISTCIYIYNI